VERPSSGDKSKIYLFPLHIKRDLVKIYVRQMDKESEGFGYLRQEFPKIIEAKMKQGIFYGRQIKPQF
jgi:hypothetical protein